MTGTYDVAVERGERLWLVHVPAVGRSTQARTLRAVEAMARDLIAIMQDVDPRSFDVTIAVELPEDVQKHLQRAQELRRYAAEAQSAASTEARTAARTLADSGMTLRDIGQALGVSYQRAHQLVRR